MKVVLGRGQFSMFYEPHVPCRLNPVLSLILPGIRLKQQAANIFGVCARAKSTHKTPWICWTTANRRAPLIPNNPLCQWCSKSLAIFFVFVFLFSKISNFIPEVDKNINDKYKIPSNFTTRSKFILDEITVYEVFKKNKL